MPQKHLRRCLYTAALLLTLSTTISSCATTGNNTTTKQAKNTLNYSATQKLLDTLPVKGRAPKTGYSRKQFSSRWKDIDHNGCDTRNDILQRDLNQIRFKKNTHGCVVESGTLNDPYSGKQINFRRGHRTSTAVQIDHIVSLSDAWQKGAQQLNTKQRENLANDPLNLLAVDGELNQQKGASDAASWLPPNQKYRCEYVSRQIFVKTKYKLWISPAEKNAMRRVLQNCP